MEYISKSVNDTHQIAKNILKKLISESKTDQALVIILKGNLGAGKTELVKGLKSFFKIKNNILSPTFVLMKVYNISNSKFKTMYHFDLYRLIGGKLKEKDIIAALDTLNIYDILNNQENIVFIEWGEKIKMLKKYNPIVIEIINTKNAERKILIS